MPSSKTMNGLWNTLRREGQTCLHSSKTARRCFSSNTLSYPNANSRTLRPIPTTRTAKWTQVPALTRTSALPSGRRWFSATSAAAHGHINPPKPGEEVFVTFVEKDGTEVKLAVSVGDDLLNVAQAHDIEMEGACEGSCSCSTCHVIVQDEAMYDKLEEATDDENDMLDLAFGLTETSRLGCQIKMTKELDGLVVKLPQMTRNMQASDFN